MKKEHIFKTIIFVIVACFFSACQQPNGGVTPQRMADAIHTVLEADRTAYTRHIVNRLVLEEKVIKASEHWQDDKALLLPAQMFRAGAELANSQDDFSYSLLSLWPINKKNAPKTEAEEQGLSQVVETGENYYTEETLGNQRFFTAIYPDKAVAEACVVCHNEHEDSPKQDFELDDVMGGIVIRIPLGS